MISSLRSTINLATTPLRRHPWVFLTCLLLFGGYGLVSLRSEVPNSSPLIPSSVSIRYCHGWPQGYLQRWADPADGSNRWRLDRGIWSFEIMPLLVNLATAICLSIAATCFWWLYYRKEKLWQVSIREILVLTLVFSAGLGGYLWIRGNYEAERNYLEGLHEVGWDHFPGYSDIPWYLLPLRDVGLAKAHDWPHWHLEWDKMDRRLLDEKQLAVDINQFLAAEVADNRQISARVIMIIIADPELSPEGLRLLPLWAPRCEHLCLYLPEGFPEQQLALIAAEFPPLKLLWIEAETISEETISHLAMLRHLEALQIYVNVEEATAPANLQRLSELPQLRHLYIPEWWQMSPEDKALFDRRQIEIEDSSGVSSICEN